MRATNAVIASIVVIAAGSTISAYALDLTVNSSGTIKDAFFARTETQPTGSGFIDSFVRVSGNESVIDGYNATARPVMPEVNTSPTFTHDIQLGHVPIVVNPVGAVPGSYYEFLLDINQTGANPFLSLDALQLYTRSFASGPIANANLLSSLTGVGSGNQLRYSLDPPDNVVLMDYSINSGSGSGDVLAYFPVTMFAGASPNDFVYLYSMFGLTGGSYENNDGYEEWAVRAAPVPDGGTSAILLGMGLSVLGLLRRKLSF